MYLVIIPQPSMVSTSSSTTADYDLDTLLLDSQAEPLLDLAGWKETEGSEHRCLYIINSFIPAAHDSRLGTQQNLPPKSPDKISK